MDEHQTEPHDNGKDTRESMFAELRIHYRTGRSYLIRGSGRNKEMGYRTGVMTDLGDLELSDWIGRIKAIIAQFGEQETYENLLQWLKEHNYAKESLQDLQLNALEIHSMRIFDDPAWVGYIPWNRRFRPDELDESTLVWIETECCHKPGQTTKEQIKRAYQDRVYCPHCGRHSTYTECSQKRKESTDERKELPNQSYEDEGAD